MSGTGRLRTEAAAAASRLNGARSLGPRSRAGKARSAQNSRKHGLFCADWTAHDEASPALADLAEFTAGLVAGRADLEDQRREVLTAAAKAERTAGLLQDLNALLAAVFEADDDADHDMIGLLGQIMRLANYHRRFQGQRDRGLRALLKESSPFF